MTTSQYKKLDAGPIDDIDAAIWSGDTFHNRGNIEAFRRMMDRWEAGLQQAEEIAREIDKQVMEMSRHG